MLLTLPSYRLVLESGDMLTFVCAVAFAAHILWIGHLARRSRFETVAVVQLALTAVLCWLAANWIEEPFWRPTPALWAALAFTGLFGTSVAFAVQAWAQQYTSTTRAAVIFALEPAVAGLTGYVVFGERLAGRAITGAFLILAGILLAELKPIRLPRHPSN
jgi:drug/metabolite transporter (DMT)-like permease